MNYFDGQECPSYYPVGQTFLSEINNHAAGDTYLCGKEHCSWI